MEGMLSQDEINALLSGMDIDAIHGASLNGDSATKSQELLTDIEKDAIGEIANISMGTSATTLYSLVNRKVNITTPVVTVTTWDTVLEHYEKPCVFIQIKYTLGLEGANILVLKEQDVKVITDLMMGGDGTNTDSELGELHLSAISEAMNQMMGSSATSLSSMLGQMIDISPPEASLVNLLETHAPGDIAPFLEGEFVKISFRMQIDDLVDSIIVQLYPLDFAKSLYQRFVGGAEPEVKQEPIKEPEPYVPPVYEKPFEQVANPAMNMMPDNMSQMGMNPMGMNQMGMNQMGMNQMGMNQMGMNQMGMNQMGMNQMGMNQMGMNPMGMNQMGMNQMGMNQMGMNQPVNMNIQPASFQSFSNDFGAMASQENIGLIMDVPLEVTVELGRTRKSISDILEFAPGTIIELDKIAGEPIDVLVNGKFVAKGEVVVIEESFGIRVTEIIK